MESNSSTAMSGFVKRGEPWGEWKYMVGVENGYHVFMDKNDFDSFLEKYREEHKDDRSTHSTYASDEDNGLPRTGKIGF